MELALPVRHPKAASQTLLKVGYELESSASKRLVEFGVRTVWVRYPALDYLDKYVSSEVLQAQSELISDITDTFEKVQRSATARLDYDQYTKSVGRLVESLVSNPQAAIYLGDIDGDGADLMRHASTVTYLSVLTGLKLEGYLVKQRKHVDPIRAKEVNNLGVGAMLHDIGILHLDPEVRERYMETGDELDKDWREHPTVGYRLVRGNIEPTAATVVLNHHQRVDGSGYAGKEIPVLEGQRIHIFARIVAVADAFDEYQHPIDGRYRPTVEVLRTMIDPAAVSTFDIEVMRAFFTVVPAFAPGSMLQLNDGRYAVAVDGNPNEPCRPKVQIVPPPESSGFRNAEMGEVVDLFQYDGGIRVVKCDGYDVSAFDFELPVDLRADQLSWV